MGMGYELVNCLPIVPSESNALGLSLPISALAGVLIEDAMPVEVLEPVLELPCADMLMIRWGEQL
jgi:hypothetical protein